MFKLENENRLIIMLKYTQNLHNLTLPLLLPLLLKWLLLIIKNNLKNCNKKV